MTDTTLMSIPGQVDPVPVARDITPREDGRVDLIGLPKADIAVLFEGAGLDKKQAKLRAKQVFHWLYHRGVTEFEAMTDIAKTMRPWLAERFVIGRPDVVEAQHSNDGTRKWLLRTADGHEFEMVFIPDADRGTLCVSSQVGCTLNCTFCHTGTMRLVRNLTPGEIVGQVMLARDALGEWPKGKMDFAEDADEAEYRSDGRLLTNIVMMGMGEPLYNFDNVRDALHIVPAGHEHVLRNALAASTTLSAISAETALATVPILDADYVSAAALESGGGDLDVDAILQGHVRRFKANGGTLLTGSEVTAIEASNHQVSVDFDHQRLRAKVVVNAAGAWADHIATLAGIDPIGLTPKRRTAFLVPAPDRYEAKAWPLVIDQVNPLYFKPDAGTLLLSPMDETPSVACDAAPEELDVAIAADRYQTCTSEQVSRVSHQWAGLRTFASDETFVVGFEPSADGFFWLAGQGGYGVQTAPALSRLAAGLIAEALGVKETAEMGAGSAEKASEWRFVDAVSPQRFRR